MMRALMSDRSHADVNLLLKELAGDLLRWEGKVTQEKEAKAIVFAPLEYSIRMTWLGRRDKLRRELYDAINQLSVLLLDEELAFSPARGGDVALKGHDHYALSKALFEDIWDLYLCHEQTTLKKPEIPKPLTLWQRLKSVFGL